MLDRLVKSVDERFAQLSHRRRFKVIQQNGPPLLFVHQMGKVGSTALVDSLKEAKGPRRWRVHQTHFLSLDGMALVESLEAEAYGGWSNMPSRKRRLLSRNRLLSKRFADGEYSQFEVKLMSTVRDPVATNVSGFFHNYHWWPSDLAARCRSKSPGWEEALLERFLEHYPHDVPAGWFDLEMKGVFGIDVFAKDFDHANGYQLYESDSYPLLLTRLENFNEPLEEAICDYLDLDSFSFSRANAASDKWYADLYRRFRNTVPLPSDYLDRVYGAAAVRHFYTPAEIAAFRRKWEQPSSINL